MLVKFIQCLLALLLCSCCFPLVVFCLFCFVFCCYSPATFRCCSSSWKGSSRSRSQPYKVCLYTAFLTMYVCACYICACCIAGSQVLFPCCSAAAANAAQGHGVPLGKVACCLQSMQPHSPFLSLLILFICFAVNCIAGPSSTCLDLSLCCCCLYPSKWEENE